MSRRPIALLGLLLLLRPEGGPAVAAGDEPPKRVEASLVILTPLDIASVAVLDDKSPARDALVAWVKPVFAAVESQFAGETARRTVVVQVTLHPDRPAEVAIAGRPALKDAEIKALAEVADATKAPRSRIADCVLRVVAKVNGGDPEENGPLSPRLPTPIERRLAEFRAATTPARLAMLKRWGRSEAIPLMAHLASGVDPKFVGVRNVGAALKRVGPEGPVDVAALTDRNPDYWRAMLEMAQGDPFVTAVRVALHAANGEIDSARRIARTLAPFDRHRSGFSALLGEFAAMADLFSEDVEARIREGIALNDAGKFDEALAAYDRVLKDYPKSAWAHYERYQTQQAKNLPGGALPDWDATRKAILESDPLYGSMARASSADELYDLLLRKETEDLFKDRTRSVRDLLRYADIAVDLGQPGFAALIYWNVASGVKPEDYANRDLIEDVLYCLERLGAKGIKENFKGDHAAEFARIDAERAKRKSESPASRVMKRK